MIKATLKIIMIIGINNNAIQIKTKIILMVIPILTTLIFMMNKQICRSEYRCGNLIEIHGIRLESLASPLLYGYPTNLT